RLEGDIQRALDKLPHGASAVEEFSDHIFHAIREAWTYGKMEREDDQVRSAWVLIAAMKTPVLEGLLLKISLEFDKIDPAALEPALAGLLEASVESPVSASAAVAPEGAAGAKPQGKSALAQYATNLTQRAKDGKIDPVIGRDMEIRQIIDIL